MGKEMIYATRDKEYQLAGWVGTIQIMQEAGAMVLSNELHPHLKGGTIGTYALRLCVNLYQKPDQFKRAVSLMLRNGSTQPDVDKYLQALEMIKAAEGIDDTYRLSETFSDALDITCNEDTRMFVANETDFFRLEDLIAHEVSFNRRYIPRMVENLDTDAYMIVQREIDFRVGLDDPARR